MNGVTVYINENWYWFESVEKLEDILDSNCNDAGYDCEKDGVIEYDKDIKKEVVRNE